MNGSNNSSDEAIADIVPWNPLLKREIRSTPFMPHELMPAASGFGLSPAGGEVPKIQ
jgi:hypothetical protein